MSQELIGIIGASIVALALAVPVHAQVDCADWNTAAFFNTAEAADATRCLQAGADPNARSETGATPLFLAAIFGRAETVTLLLEAGANPNARDEDGNTPLHFAASRGHVGAMTRLLEAGADPNAQDETGETPLHRAARARHARAVATLIGAGADLEVLGACRE